MAPNELFVVPSERHVERLAHEGLHAETRTSLCARLAAALLPDLALMDARECRLVLGVALSDDSPPPDPIERGEAPVLDRAEQGTSRHHGQGQLDLFGEATPAPTARRVGAAGARSSAPAAGAPSRDPLLSAIRARGGASWVRMVTALDHAIALFRARNGTVEHLDRVGRVKGFLGTRARTLAIAMRALDARLARAGAQDARLVGTLVAEAIRHARAEDIEAILGARSLRSRWLLAWEPSDVAWWRALDDKLAPRGGGARLVLPTFDQPLAGGRERDPLEALADDLARGLDAPMESEAIAPVLGNLSGDLAECAASVDRSRVRVISASDSVAQARAVAAEVALALDGGAAVERIAIALPILEERTLSPLRRALEEEGIVWHESRGPAPSAAPIVNAALLALDAATSLDRLVVARLLRSGWVDGARLTDAAGRDARRSLPRLARVLETSATAAGDDAVERFLRTASMRPARGKGGRTDRHRDEAAAEEAMDAAIAMKLASLFAGPRLARTRIDHVRAARSLWTALGMGARAGRGGLGAFGSDAVPRGVPAAERLAIARDARAWDALLAALDLHESAAARVGALDQAIDAASFRLELVELLDAAVSQPGAGRAAAIRIARLGDLAGDELELLVVADANDGILPRDDVHDALLSETLAEAIGRASRGEFVPPTSGALRARELSALAVSAAEAKDVVFVFSREDAVGAPLAASSVVNDLVRAGVAMRATEATPPVRSGVDVTLRVAREKERESFFLNPSRPLSDVVGDLAPPRAAARLLADETGGGERALAVTGLERFARCAFMGYAHVVLAAREVEQTRELPDAREEGTLVHEALAAAFVATKALWARRPRQRDEIVALGTAASDALLDRWQGHAALRTVVRLQVNDAVRAVLRAAVDDETWDFALAEQAFGARAATSWKSFTLDQEEVHLALRGSIDRVDLAHDGHAVRVIDYKRSKSTVTAAGSALGETALQVPLYACVASQELDLPASGAYMPTQAKDVAFESKPSSRAVQRMDELVARASASDLAEIERRALAIVASARSGALAPIPARESECRLCAVSGGCRKPRFAMAPTDDLDDEPDAVGLPRDAS